MKMIRSSHLYVILGNESNKPIKNQIVAMSFTSQRRNLYFLTQNFEQFGDFEKFSGEK